MLWVCGENERHKTRKESNEVRCVLWKVKRKALPGVD